MRSFDYIESGKTLLTPHTTSLLAAIHEAKGRQSIQTTIRPDILGTLVAVARIQSTDASNRIEGISTSDSRLNDLVSEKVTPRNRNEEEIAGYRDALSVIRKPRLYSDYPERHSSTAPRPLPTHTTDLCGAFQGQ